LLLLAGEGLRNFNLGKRRALLRDLITDASGSIRYSETFNVPASVLLETVREQGLESVVAKRRDSRYECGRRSGSWVKFRANREQDFVIGGYVPSASNFDSILVGCYEGENLMYAASVRADSCRL
jgi:ATP-dependent DNA ligase